MGIEQSKTSKMMQSTLTPHDKAILAMSRKGYLAHNAICHARCPFPPLPWLPLPTAVKCTVYTSWQECLESGGLDIGDEAEAEQVENVEVEELETILSVRVCIYRLESPSSRPVVLLLRRTTRGGEHQNHNENQNSYHTLPRHRRQRGQTAMAESGPSSWYSQDDHEIDNKQVSGLFPETETPPSTSSPSSSKFNTSSSEPGDRELKIVNPNADPQSSDLSMSPFQAREGEWELPGGIITDDDLSISDAIARLVFEQTGLVVVKVLAKFDKLEDSKEEKVLLWGDDEDRNRNGEGSDGSGSVLQDDASSALTQYLWNTTMEAPGVRGENRHHQGNMGGNLRVSENTTHIATPTSVLESELARQHRLAWPFNNHSIDGLFRRSNNVNRSNSQASNNTTATTITIRNFTTPARASLRHMFPYHFNARPFDGVFGCRRRRHGHDADPGDLEALLPPVPARSAARPMTVSRPTTVSRPIYDPQEMPPMWFRRISALPPPLFHGRDNFSPPGAPPVRPLPPPPPPFHRRDNFPPPGAPPVGLLPPPPPPCLVKYSRERKKRREEEIQEEEQGESSSSRPRVWDRRHAQMIPYKMVRRKWVQLYYAVLVDENDYECRLPGLQNGDGKGKTKGKGKEKAELDGEHKHEERDEVEHDRHVWATLFMVLGLRMRSEQLRDMVVEGLSWLGKLAGGFI